MKHPFIRRLALMLALVMLLSLVGVAEDLVLDGAELNNVKEIPRN